MIVGSACFMIPNGPISMKFTNECGVVYWNLKV